MMTTARQIFGEYDTSERASAVALELCDLGLRARAEGTRVTYRTDLCEHKWFGPNADANQVGFAIERAKLLGIGA